MHALEEKIAAVDLVRSGMTYREASRICGMPHQKIWRWRQELDGRGDRAYPLTSDETRPRRGAPMDIDELPDDPEELKRIIRDQQFEIDVTRAVVDIVKKDPGVDPRTLPNREKAMLVDALKRRSPRYSTSYLASSLDLAPATFYYHRKRMGADPEAGLRERVRAACAENPAFGYRRVKRLIDEGAQRGSGVSEKRIRRIMGREGLQPPRRRRCSRYSSYDAREDNGKRLPNAPLNADGSHSFAAERPNSLWLSDVTEFLLPSGERVYLSPVLDCYDSSLPGWAISASEKAEDLTNPSLRRAAGKLREGDRCWIHTDRGGQYFSGGWIATAERFGLRRSMSRKGHSPDNARMEGFFGRLKMEFFDARDWEGVGAEEFMGRLDEWLVYYNEEREKQSLGWLSPMQYRERYYRAA